MNNPQRMSNSEYRHLVNDYLCPQICFLHFGLDSDTAAKIAKMLHYLQPFERPDMFAKINNRVYLLEHFSFDASPEGKKGMDGIREERQLARRIAEECSIGKEGFDRGNYRISLKDYQKNFEKHFFEHYEKLDSYKDHLISAGVLCDTDELSVGFFAENTYPPYYCYKGKEYNELFYFQTKQIAELLKRMDKLHFMFFGGYVEGRLQLTYVDREHLIADGLQVDLLSSDISLSRLNQNEITWYSTI